MSFAPAISRALPLPIGGKIYRIPSPSARTGLFLTNLKLVIDKQVRGEEITDEEAESLRFDDQEEQDFYKQVLGPIYDQFIEDRVDFDIFRIASQTVMTWVTANREAAERYWNSVMAEQEPDPKEESSDADPSDRPDSPDSSASQTNPEDIPGPKSSTGGTSSHATSKTEA